MSAALLRWLSGVATVELGLRLDALADELGIGYTRMHLRRQRTRWGSCSAAGTISNPLKHLAPIGALMLFLFGFGWAKPVPVNFENLHDPRRGLILISAAGIVANLFLAFTAFLLDQLLAPSPSGILAPILYYLAQINIMLAAFNL